MSRTVSSSGDVWGRSLSNEFLFNVAEAFDPFNGVLSAGLSNNVVVPDDPFNGVPSLGEGATNDGASVMLG